MFFTHTYTTATTSAPVVTGDASARDVRWKLSEVAPGTWWAVLTARDGGSFEVAARLRAGEDLDLQWTDTSAPAAIMRYKVRRECVDSRYEWLSDEVAWDLATPILLSIAESRTYPDRVELGWFGRDAGSLRATVQRRTDSTDWQEIGKAMYGGPDRLRYDDLSVSPGVRYAYRLAYEEDGVPSFTSEAWVDVPQGLFSLSGFSPNPSRGASVVGFALPATGDAQIEVVDVTGRRIARQDLHGLPAGSHVVDLRKSLPPGLYIVRLRFGDQELVARSVVLR
jgi:hypothetical protein